MIDLSVESIKRGEAKAVQCDRAETDEHLLDLASWSRARHGLCLFLWAGFFFFLVRMKRKSQDVCSICLPFMIDNEETVLLKRALLCEG